MGVISTGFAPEMVEAARRLGTEHGLDNVEYRVLDAERMDLEDDSVDVILCRAALMLMAGPGAALAESRQVLCPGGVFANSVFTTPAENPWVAVPIEVFIERYEIHDLGGRSRSPPVLLRLFTRSAALLRPLPLAMPAATRLPAEPLVRGALLEQHPAPPVGAHCQPLRIEVGIGHVVVGSFFDPTSQPAHGTDHTDGAAGPHLAVGLRHAGRELHRRVTEQARARAVEELTSEPARDARYTREHLGWGVFVLMKR